jgi:hypothetical protein
MTASTLGNHPGRAVYQHKSTKIIQAPLLTGTKLSEMMKAAEERLKQLEYDRRVIGKAVMTSNGIVRKDIQ